MQENATEERDSHILFIQDSQASDSRIISELNRGLISILSYRDPELSTIPEDPAWIKDAPDSPMLTSEGFIHLSRNHQWDDLIYMDLYPIGEYHQLMLLTSVSRKNFSEKKSGYIIETGSVSADQPNFIPVQNNNFEKSSPLICIDPGHGGMDTGAIAPDGTEEIELNNGLAIELASELRSRGYRIVFSRNPFNDTEFLPTRERADRINSLSPDLLISIHHNYSVKPSDQGYAIFYSSYKPNLDQLDTYVIVDGEKRPFVSQERRGRNPIILYKDENNITRSLDDLPWYTSYEPFIRDDTPPKESILSQFFGLLLYFELTEQNVLIPFHYSENGYIEDRDYAIVRLTDAPSVIVEVGFITNQTDLTYLKQQENQILVSEKMANAVDLFFAREKKLTHDKTLFF